jgi:hypothetical protein
MRQSPRCKQRLRELIDAILPTHELETDTPTHDLELSFGQLALVYKSLQAAKTLGALPPQDELLNDTLQLVDVALKKAV